MNEQGMFMHEEKLTYTHESPRYLLATTWTFLSPTYCFLRLMYVANFLRPWQIFSCTIY